MRRMRHLRLHQLLPQFSDVMQGTSARLVRKTQRLDALHEQDARTQKESSIQGRILHQRRRMAERAHVDRQEIIGQQRP